MGHRSVHVMLAACLMSSLIATTGSSAGLAPADEPLLVQQWHHQTVRSTDAWKITLGGGVTVAIIDTLIDTQHRDLTFAGGVTSLGPECAANGCGSGDDDDDPKAGNPSHGTHVAGIVGARLNGMAGLGMAPDADLLGVYRGLGYARAIRWAVDAGADVINLSQYDSIGAAPVFDVAGQTGLDLDTVGSAVEYALANDVVVAAAGNYLIEPYCTSMALRALCVTATDRRDLPATYSNRGFKRDLESVAAPGGEVLAQPIEGDAPRIVDCNEQILSILPDGNGNASVDCLDESDRADHEYLAGTSMAAPIVSGVAALVKSMGCSARETIDIVLDTARMPYGITADWFPGYGHGIVDAGAAVNRAAQIC